MKGTFFIALTSFLFLSATAWSQEDSTAMEIQPQIKQGWTFGVLPVLTYDTDIGFQYGGLVNLYDFGDGSRYPEYDHSLFFEISRTTKGSGINRFFYDSDRLIGTIRTTVDLSYLTEKALNFYGFNGYVSRYIPKWEDDEDPAYKTRVFYRHERKMLRLKFDLMGKLAGEHWYWVGGLAYYNFMTATVDIERLNKNQSGNNQLPDTATIYDHYVDWGLIPANAAEGGKNFYLKFGVMFDSRDQRANPMKGVWTEAAIRWAPSFIANKNYPNTQLGITHRQYFTIIPRDLSFAYRLAYQTTLSGEVPWYLQPVMMTTYLNSFVSQGLGGGKTLRGILRNRIVGDGFFYGNVEFRWKVFRTTLFKQHLYIALNAFLDGGMVVHPIYLDTSEVPAAVYNDYFDQEKDSMHGSYGAGVRFAMNENFIVAFDYGRTIDRRDGISGFYVGLNYLY